MGTSPSLWNDAAALSRLVTWLTVVGLAAPFLCGLGVLIAQLRANELQSTARRADAAKIAGLERRIQSRRLSHSQRSVLSAELASRPGEMLITSPVMSGEGSDYAEDLASAFRAAGWTAHTNKTFLDTLREGIHVGGYDTSTARPQRDYVINACRCVGIETHAFVARHSSLNAPGVFTDVLVVAIGRHP